MSTPSFIRKEGEVEIHDMLKRTIEKPKALPVEGVKAPGETYFAISLSESEMGEIRDCVRNGSVGDTELVRKFDILLGGIQKMKTAGLI